MRFSCSKLNSAGNGFMTFGALGQPSVSFGAPMYPYVTAYGCDKVNQLS